MNKKGLQLINMVCVFVHFDQILPPVVFPESSAMCSARKRWKPGRWTHSMQCVLIELGFSKAQDGRSAKVCVGSF